MKNFDSNKFIKGSHSQKNLLKGSLLNITSPKYLVPHKESNQAVLTPANKNLPAQEQPRKPRILNKVKHSTLFSDEFKLGKILGKGRFGNVHMAFHNATESVYAVKKISL